METSLESPNRMNTWKIVKLSPDQIIVRTRWLFDNKQNSEGAIVRPKACLVAKEFTQIDAIDNQELYSPVSHYVAVRFLIALSVKQNHKRRLLNVQNALVNSKLK